MRHIFVKALATTTMLTAQVALAQDAADLQSLSLQQLADIEVTSVSKKAEKASRAAAAIYVITQEDIRRSGMQSVPELLRMVPGLQVSRSGSQNWAVTSRGFNGQFANKLLVLVDGRSVYGAVFSGVNWDVQNLLLEDIDRIEVIRGPGATLWGANAVNGVINIITKSTADTQGTLLTGAAGNQGGRGGARYGGREGDATYRSYAQYTRAQEEQTRTGAGAGDDWFNYQGGFRVDWGQQGNKQVTFQGDAYSGRQSARRYLPVTSSVSPSRYNVVEDTDSVSGMNLLGRWRYELEGGSDITFQTYYDSVRRKSEFVGSSNHTQTIDFDFQHNIELGSRHDLTWGLGYRFIDSGFTNGFYISFTPEDYYENLFSFFVQDKITLLPDELFFTLGTKLEHNDFSGYEYEPSARLSWLPTENQTVWASVSRAVRAPTQADQNINIILASQVTPPPASFIADTTLVAERGEESEVSESVISYELGYRIQPQEHLSFDVTAFLNKYHHLASLGDGNATVQASTTLGSYIYFPLINQFNNSGETRGVELAATWEVMPSLKVSGGYTMFYSKLNITGESLVTKPGTAPDHQFNIRSYADLPHNLQWDTMFYYMDQLDGLGIPAHARLDMRLGWVPVQGLDVSLIGQNLLDPSHPEYSPFIYQAQGEIGRTVLATATLRF